MSSEAGFVLASSKPQSGLCWLWFGSVQAFKGGILRVVQRLLPHVLAPGFRILKAAGGYKLRDLLELLNEGVVELAPPL
jgi:hypothetical protein